MHRSRRRRVMRIMRAIYSRRTFIIRARPRARPVVRHESVFFSSSSSRKTLKTVKNRHPVPAGRCRRVRRACAGTMQVHVRRDGPARARARPSHGRYRATRSSSSPPPPTCLRSRLHTAAREFRVRGAPPKGEGRSSTLSPHIMTAVAVHTCVCVCVSYYARAVTDQWSTARRSDYIVLFQVHVCVCVCERVSV